MIDLTKLQDFDNTDELVAHILNSPEYKDKKTRAFEIVASMTERKYPYKHIVKQICFECHICDRQAKNYIRKWKEGK